MATKKKQAAPKRYTVKEFKTWIEGISEFQPADWCPDAAQWKIIREKIGNLNDEVEVRRVSNNQSTQSINQANESSQGRQMMDQPSRPVVNTSGTLAYIPANQEGTLNLLPETIGEPVEKIQVATVANPPMAAQQVSSTVRFSGKQYKTPNVDSSKGYNSPFGG
jgi:hypothetical protein